MITNPDLVLYTCIARQLAIDSPDSVILAEFNSVNSSLQEVAQQCLTFTPPHHTIYSQTLRNQTYTFLLDYPFVYFGIFDPKMMKFDQVKLLDCLRDTLRNVVKGNFDQKFTSFCLQGELHPIFDELLSQSEKSLDFDGSNGGVSNDNVSSESSSRKGRKIMALPMLSNCKIAKGLKKKRMSSESITDSKEALTDGKVDVLDDSVDVGVIKSREIVCQNGVCFLDGHGNGNGNGNGGNVGRQKAKKIWRRHVWIVLVLDLAVCLILFGIWLFVCRGFQCIEG